MPNQRRIEESRNTDEKPDGTKTREQENHRRERVEQQDLAREKLKTRSTNRRKRPPKSNANSEKLIAPDQKKQLFIEVSTKITTGPQRSPPSHPYLIGNVKCVLGSLLH
jgi:hypothetical protein